MLTMLLMVAWAAAAIYSVEEDSATCMRMCTMNLRPVCASNGQTYSKYTQVLLQ